MGVNIGADTETKHARGAGGFADILHDLPFACDTDGGSAVGEKNHHERPIALGWS